MGLDGDKNILLKEIEELESEIEEIKKRIPPHSVKYEIIQLLEEKEEELRRKRLFFNRGEKNGLNRMKSDKIKGVRDVSLGFPFL